MRIQTIRYIFKEGFLYFFRNKLMGIASCAIITAALIILGVFALLLINIDSNLKALGEKPQIRIYCRHDLGDAEVFALEDEIRAEPGIREFEFIAKDAAFVRAKEILGEDAGMLDGLGPDFLPVSFLVRLDDPGMVEAFVRKVEVMGAVEKVDYPKKAIDFIAGISGWVKAFGLAIACIPMLFALFIISNTIRLAVFERSGEISIMRYIGATEHLIRWPFVVEGVLIGALGAAAAYLLTRFGYSIVESSFNAGVAGVSNNFVSLAAAGSVSAQLLALDLLFGVLIGAVGSAQAIRKHLRA